MAADNTFMGTIKYIHKKNWEYYVLEIFELNKDTNK